MFAHRASTQDYRAALLDARRSSTLVEGATSSPEELPEDASYYLTEDLLSGYGVTTDGTLIALFSLAKGRGDLLLGEAVTAGARTLDCFDGFLPAYYGARGWRETHREANWTPGAPDVVYMAYVGT